MNCTAITDGFKLRLVEAVFLSILSGCLNFLFVLRTIYIARLQIQDQDSSLGFNSLFDVIAIARQSQTKHDLVILV